MRDIWNCFTRQTNPGTPVSKALKGTVRYFRERSQIKGKVHTRLREYNRGLRRNPRSTTIIGGHLLTGAIDTA